MGLLFEGQWRDVGYDTKSTGGAGSTNDKLLGETGGALCARPGWAILGRDEEKAENAALAEPIRGLVRKNGKLLQPIKVTVQQAGPGATVVTRLDAQEVDRRSLSGDAQFFDVYTAPVSSVRLADVEVEAAGKSSTAKVSLYPVRKVQVYILPHSHHDLGYTDLQANVEEKQMLNILKGIDLARRTANYQEGARFVWNLEVLWGADLFMRRRSQAEKDEFIDAVKRDGSD